MTRLGWRWLGAWACVVVAGLFRIWVHQDITQVGYAIGREERAIRHQEQERAALEVERAAQRAPAELQTIARGLGLFRPQPQDVRAVEAKHAPR